MKLKHPIFLILFLCLYQSLLAQGTHQYREVNFIIAGGGCSQGSYVLYKFTPQDIDSYQHIEEHYGKDMFHVYYKGNPLDYIDVEKAKIIFVKDKETGIDLYKENNLLLSDGTFTYYNDVLMKDVDLADLHYMSDDRIPLFRSNNHIYYQGYLLDRLNADKTEVIDFHTNENFNFFTDSIWVYRNEILVENADAKSFRSTSNTLKLFDGKNYYYETADSYDDNNFYKNSRIIPLYQNWTEIKMFPDSIYNDQYIVTFNAEFEIEDDSYKPVDFYLSLEDLEFLTKNKVLQRKKKLKLSKRPFINDVGTYSIKVYKNQELTHTFYYQKDLEEFDIKDLTQIHIIGDGFYFPQEDFVFWRSLGKHIKHREETIDDLKEWQNRITELKNNPKVITIDTAYYHYWPKDKDGKIYRKYLYEYKLNEENEIYTRMHSYEGMFTLKVEGEKANQILGQNLRASGNELQNLKKILIEELIGKGNYFVHNSMNNEDLNNIEWIYIDIYCSRKKMDEISPELIKESWQPILYTIDWQEK